MLRMSRVKDELKEFYEEIVVDNGPRYKDVREWSHLYVDLWVSLFSMSYTLGHIAAVLVPLLVLGFILG